MKINFQCVRYILLSDFVVEKVVTLPETEFKKLLGETLKSQAFIAENIEWMKQDSDGVIHCLLVANREGKDGVLIDSDGHDWPYSVAYVPETATLRYPIFSKINQSLLSAVDFIVEQSTLFSKKERWKLSFDELEKQTNLCLKGETFLQETLRAMLLCDRGPIAELNFRDEYMEIAQQQCFRPDEPKGITQVNLQF